MGQRDRPAQGHAGGTGAVTRVVRTAKGGIHGPQRECRARAGPALHQPPLITFSGPLPAGTDNAGPAFEVEKGRRGGSRSRRCSLPPAPGIGGRLDKTLSRWQPGPRMVGDKGKTNRFGARRMVPCLRPSRGAALPMMDGPRPARAPGRAAIYITQPVHRSPLTRPCLQQRPRGPGVPPATRGPQRRRGPCQAGPAPSSGPKLPPSLPRRPSSSWRNHQHPVSIRGQKHWPQEG